MKKINFQYKKLVETKMKLRKQLVAVNREIAVYKLRKRMGDLGISEQDIKKLLDLDE